MTADSKLTKEQVKIIKEWIAALRSGKYEQGRGKLKDHASGKVCHCCLGVLCELAAEHGTIGPATLLNDIYFFENHSGNLPNKVRDWAGLSLKLGFLQELMDMNDSGKSFAVIADFIEVHLVKTLWLEALESGEYKQARQVLCNKGSASDPESEVGYCCLGVLCEVAIKYDLVPLVRLESKESDEYGLVGVSYLYKGAGYEEGKAKSQWRYSYAHNTCLPSQLLPALHLRDMRGAFPIKAGGPDNLAEVNDKCDDFTKVIDLIKHNLPFKDLPPTGEIVVSQCGDWTIEPLVPDYR